MQVCSRERVREIVPEGGKGADISHSAGMGDPLLQKAEQVVRRILATFARGR